MQAMAPGRKRRPPSIQFSARESQRFLGGHPSSRSTSLQDRITLLDSLLPEVGLLEWHNLSHSVLDAVLWRCTGQQPAVRVGDLAADPQSLAGVLLTHMSSQLSHTAKSELAQEVQSLNGRDKQLAFVERAKATGFQPLWEPQPRDLARVAIATHVATQEGSCDASGSAPGREAIQANNTELLLDDLELEIARTAHELNQLDEHAKEIQRKRARLSA